MSMQTHICIGLPFGNDMPFNMPIYGNIENQIHIITPRAECANENARESCDPAKYLAHEEICFFECNIKIKCIPYYNNYTLTVTIICDMYI